MLRAWWQFWNTLYRTALHLIHVVIHYALHLISVLKYATQDSISIYVCWNLLCITLYSYWNTPYLTFHEYWNTSLTYMIRLCVCRAAIWYENELTMDDYDHTYCCNYEWSVITITKNNVCIEIQCVWLSWWILLYKHEWFMVTITKHHEISERQCELIMMKNIIVTITNDWLLQLRNTMKSIEIQCNDIDDRNLP